MTISNAMLDRGKAHGLQPSEDESAKAFGARVRRAEKASKQPAPSGAWRRR